MSLRNSRELRTIAECIDALLAGDLPHLGDLLMQRMKAVQTAVVEGNWNLAQHLELTPTSGSNVVSPAELRAAQRTQLDHLRLQNSGKGGGKGSARTPLLPLPPSPPRDSAREEEEHRLLPAGHPPRAGASTLRSKRGGRKGRWRSSHRSQPDARSPVPVPTPKSPPPLQKARLLASPARTVPPLQASGRRTASRSPSAGVEWGRLQSHRMFTVKWQSEVFNQKHRWTNESVSEKARSEKRLVTVHHRETGRNFNVERVLSVDRAVTLRRWASGAFWCDSSRFERSHVSNIFGSESGDKFENCSRCCRQLVSLCATVGSFCSFVLPCFSPWLQFGRCGSSFARHVDGRKRSYVAACSQVSFRSLITGVRQASA